MTYAPPPRRAGTAPSSRASTPDTPAHPTWKDRVKARGAAWGKVAVDKSVVISDNVGNRVNGFAERRLGTEAFWPVSGDFPKEMDKCARILRTFTVEGVVTEDKKLGKILRKIPYRVIREAKGLAIFTSMRSGIAPLGGAGGAGLVVARLPDGSWSAPASISPQNLSTGLLIGVDIYDCVLVIRSQAALDSFGTHKVTLGSEIAVVAGPWGAGGAVETGTDRAPVFSYIRSKGMFAGIEIVGQAFVSRFDENAGVYHWPGIKARDILEGKVTPPPEAANLMQALRDAESGHAQGAVPESQIIHTKARRAIPPPMAIDPTQKMSEIVLDDGEVLKLPPTPDMTTGDEYESDPETERVIHKSDKRPPLPPRRRPVPATASAPGSAPSSPPPPLPARSSARPVSQDFHKPPMAHDALSPISATSVNPVTPLSPPGHDVPIASASAPPIPTGPPPAYDVPSAGLAVPVSEKAQAGSVSPASVYSQLSDVPVDTQGAPAMVAGWPDMSDAERREWEHMSESERREWQQAMGAVKQRETEGVV